MVIKYVDLAKYIHFLVLVDLQSQLNMAIAREHTAAEKERTMESKLKGIETQIDSFKQAKSQLVAALEMEKAKAEAVQEELDRYKNMLKCTCSYIHCNRIY